MLSNLVRTGFQIEFQRRKARENILRDHCQQNVVPEPQQVQHELNQQKNEGVPVKRHALAIVTGEKTR